MPDLHFTLADCDEVVRKCSQNHNIRTIDFEIIPRQENNYIFKITTEKPTSTLTLYAKSRSQPPGIEKVLQDFKTKLEAFDSNITPRFFGGKSDLLFFEDLTYQKFQTNPNCFDLKHVQTVLKVLAKFHAAAFAYQHDFKNLKEDYDLEDENFDVDAEEDRLWSSLDNKERLDEIKEDLKKRQKSSKFVKILCHGNLISTNIMFHYENGVPDQCRLLNFQTKLYAPPLYDVLQLIFFNTNEDFRRCHFDTLLACYYKNLEEELEKLSVNIENISIEDLQSSSYELLPLIKLEAAKVKKDKTASQELEEIFKFQRLTREDCYIIVKNVLKTTNYKILSFDEDEEKQSHYRLRIRIRQSSEDDVITCYVKCTNKKLFIYDTFLPKLEDLSINTSNDCVPCCHLCKREDLVLEDLSSKDYQVSNEPYDFNLLSLVVRKLAKYHAGTFLLEEEMSQRLKISYRYDHHFANDCFSDKNLKIIVELFPEFTTKFEDQNLYERLSKFFANSSGCFRKVVSFGRLSNEDILIKFDDGRPVDCRFVNYESIGYVPPASDFLSVLYCTTNKQTRVKNEEELKKIYYDELGEIISSYNHKMSKCFPYEEFVESLGMCRLKVIIEGIIDKTTDNNEMEVLSKFCENSDSKAQLGSKVADLLEACSMLPKL